MNSDQYVAAIKTGNKTTFEELDGAMTQLQQATNPDCAALPHVKSIERCQTNALKRVLRNQELDAEYKTNGGGGNNRQPSMRIPLPGSSRTIDIYDHAIASMIVKIAILSVLVYLVLALHGKVPWVHLGSILVANGG